MASTFFEFREEMNRKRTAQPVEAALSAGGDIKAITVTELTVQIDKALRGAFPKSIWVRGEISNINRQAASGHIYFTLKDSAACIDCALWKQQAAALKFKPTDGMEILANAMVRVYQARGRYQLIVTSIQPLGQGALELAFQQLRAKLEAEGLFASERKKVLPRFPRRICLVTSRQAAALQDMLKVLRSYPWLKMFVYHVPVQGDGSAERIAAALDHLSLGHSQVGGIDAILLARGGGSLEDLWEFNEEVVARAMARCAIPIVSGIGHEVDVSIADLVADYHAHTPTEAAQVITRQWKNARTEMDVTITRIARSALQKVGSARQRFLAIARHEVFRRPTDRIAQMRQLADDRARNLRMLAGQRVQSLRRALRAMEDRFQHVRPQTKLARRRDQLIQSDRTLSRLTFARLRIAGERLRVLASRLGAVDPRADIHLRMNECRSADARLRASIAQGLKLRMRTLEGQSRHLNAVGPENVLKRGYSITILKRTGQIVQDASAVREGDRLVTRVATGEVESLADDPKQRRLF